MYVYLLSILPYILSSSTVSSFIEALLVVEAMLSANSVGVIEFNGGSSGTATIKQSETCACHCRRAKDLQCLRALAIVAVVGIHLLPRHFPNGYLGVDVFFVLSGFLMAKILDSDDKQNEENGENIKRDREKLGKFLYRTELPLYVQVVTADSGVGKCSASICVVFDGCSPPTCSI